MKKQVFNPYLPNDEYVPDGEPKVFGDRVYVYGSHDRFNGEFYCVNDYVGYSAPVDDLSDWRFEGVIYKKDQDPLNPDGKYNMFAPDVVQGQDGRFYMYYGMDFINQISVAVADKPEGPFEYYGAVRHPEGILLGEKSTDAFQFDPGVLVDDDNRVWLYTGFAPGEELQKMFREVLGISFNKAGNYVTELEADMLTVKTDPVQLIPNTWDSEGTGFEGHAFYEASSIRKFNGKYYFIYSSELSHELAYAISDYPDRGFVYGGSLHSNGDIGYQGNTEVVNYWGNNHGSVACINGEYYIFGHRQTNYTEFSRQGVAEKLKMTADGRFEMAEMTSCGLNQGPLRGTGSYPAAIACQLYSGRGALKSTEVLEKEEHPCFTQEKEDSQNDPSQYIHNLKDGSVAGFKYFHFDDLNSLSVTTRGPGKGLLGVYTELEKAPIAEIHVNPSTDWQTFEANVSGSVGGEQPLFFRYEGPGMIDFKAFALG